MEFQKDIGSFLNRPWAIDLVAGFNAFAETQRNLQLISKSPDFAKQLIKEREEASSIKVFSPNNIQLNQGDFSSVPSNSIAIVPLIGTMIAEDGFCTRGIDYTCNQLNAALGNPNIIGVVLRTNSGGGEVTAAQRLANSIVEFRQSKPVVQYIDGMSASGAVFAGCNCDEIIAGGRSTFTGSVGVVSEYNKEWLAWVKEAFIPVYADISDQKHEEFNALLNGETAPLKNLFLNPIAKEFQSIVTSNLNVDTEHLRGRMYIAGKAKKIGLVNSIGTMNDALSRVRILSKRRNRATTSKKVVASINF